MKLKDIKNPPLRVTGKCYSVVEECRANDSDFCREVVERGWLTEEQMAHAAERYRLGKSKSGRCIFWMIDDLGRMQDGHIGDTWVSVMLKAREPQLLSNWYVTHCLFGQQLLSMGNEHAPVCVVEKEGSAVILSELFPECIWLATVYPANLNVFVFECLQGREVMLFPPTDETMTTFVAWMEVADEVRRRYHICISVNDILEENTTAEQKAKGVDLVGFLFEG